MRANAKMILATAAELYDDELVVDGKGTLPAVERPCRCCCCEGTCGLRGDAYDAYIEALVADERDLDDGRVA